MNFGAIISGFILSGAGFVAFIYGRKESSWKPMAVGVAVMAMPYFVTNIWVLWGVSITLLGSLWIFRD